MNVQLIITFIILTCSIILFMSNRVRADLVAVLALLALVLTGILDSSKALIGFSNSVVIMIAGLFIVGAGILRTGLAQMAGNVLLRSSGDSEKKLFIFLLIIVAFVGAFMGFERLGFFQITPIGIIEVIVGIIYLYAVRNVLLPSGGRKDNSKDEHRLSPKQLASDYQLGGQLYRFLFFIKLSSISRLIVSTETNYKIS